MYNYSQYYYYEATSFPIGGNVDLVLDDTYIIIGYLITILLAIMAFDLMLFTAISIKKARPLGITVAIAQPIGVFAFFQTVLAYSKIDFSCLYITVTGKSQEDAMSKLYDTMLENFVEEILPQAALFILWAFIAGIVTILTIIYAGMLFGAKGKVFAIFAFIILIGKHFLMSPVELISIYTGQVSQEIQSIWDVVFRFFIILPLFLLAVQGLINLLSNAKQKKKEKEALAAKATETVQ